MEAVILAGGEGRRLKAEVKDIPKPMADVCGRPFLRYLLDYWASQGVSRFVLSVGYKGAVIKQYFKDSYRGIEIDYAEEKGLMGTGGGLFIALEKLKHRDAFLVLNGDTYFEVPLNKLVDFHAKNGSDITLGLFGGGNYKRYGRVEIDKGSRLRGFHSCADSPGPGLYNGGIYLVNPDALRQFGYDKNKPLSLEKDVFPNMILGGKRLFGYFSRERFIDMGTPESYRELKRFLAK